MPGKEPVGSTANLPDMADIEAAEAATPADIDEMFGMASDDETQTPPDGGAGQSAPGEGAGAGVDEGSSPAPVTPPPSDGAAATPPATQPDGSTPPSGQQPAQAAPSPTPGTPPAPVAPVDAEALLRQSLEAQVQGLQAEVQRLRASPPAAPTQQPPGGGSAGADDLPRYQLNLPPQVAAALTSGDDQQTVAGITHMMNSLATIVHHNVRLEMSQRFGQLINAAREQDSQASTSTAINEAREDYYKAFPGHKDPLILPLIQAETMQMATEFPGLAWSDNYRNALGQRVEGRLAQLRGGAQGSNGGTPPALPATSLPSGGPRTETQGGELTGGDLIMDTFS